MLRHGNDKLLFAWIFGPLFVPFPESIYRISCNTLKERGESLEETIIIREHEF